MSYRGILAIPCLAQIRFKKWNILELVIYKNQLLGCVRWNNYWDCEKDSLYSDQACVWACIAEPNKAIELVQFKRRHHMDTSF